MSDFTKETENAIKKTKETGERLLKNIKKAFSAELKQPKQENKMQKFENGEEVELYSYSNKKWLIGYKYVSYDKGNLDHHVVLDPSSVYMGVAENAIRPVQLICDEARELILDFADKKKPMMFYVESDKQLNELCDFMEGVCIVPNKQYNRGARLVSWRDGYQCLNQLDHRVAGHCKELGFNELNLKTGEVIPREVSFDLNKGTVHTEDKDKRKDWPSCDFNSLCDSPSPSPEDGDYFRFESGQLNFAPEVASQLKEKDAEIERLKLIVDIKTANIDILRKGNESANASFYELCEAIEKIK